MNSGAETEKLPPPGAKRIPRATYRLQFNRHFTFKQAREIVDYLRDLGVSDAYASPLFQAGPESTHGYDICCFGQVNERIGTEQDFVAFTDALQKNRMGLLLDMVPNHMGADLSNQWWMDVLEKGPASNYASYFDIDWQPLKSDLHNKVLLPVLGDHYGKVLARGELKLRFEDGRFWIAYYDKKFPVAPHSYAQLAGLREKLQAGGETLAGVEELDALLRQQHYRLAYWRVGSEEINYRRFFDVASLISLRMEREEVFEATHKTVFNWLAQGRITGLRIDHPDGLWDPWRYFERLQSKYASEAGANDRYLYVVAEKILSGDEPLPSDWAVDGTTGYDFLNELNGIFVQQENAKAFDALYQEITGEAGRFEDLVYSSKKVILQRSLYSEWQALSHRFKRIAGASRETQDLTLRQIQTALGAIIAAFPVYRTYAREGRASLSEQEADYVKEACAKARARERTVDPHVWIFLEILLLLRGQPGISEAECSACLELVMKFQQLSGPVMAKGLEDTAFYNYNRLVSLNEVGGSPGNFGNSPSRFHRYNAMRAKLWRHSLSATATHDTKRGEDLRARLNVLSEMPAQWRAVVLIWGALNAQKKQIVHGHPAPHPNDEYLLYQTLVGAWTLEAEESAGLKHLRERIAAYMEKALRESKARSSWTDPDNDYENGVREFVETILEPSQSAAFLDSLKKFHKTVAYFGVFNSLAQTILKVTAPGVPDFYQGSELWDFSLVDPDNRRPVDYAVRKQLFADLELRLNKSSDRAQLAASLLAKPADGQIKMFVTHLALQCRAQNRDCFELGDYRAQETTGPASEHIFAFERRFQGRSIVCAVPRLAFTLQKGRLCAPIGPEVWKETFLHLPEQAGVGLVNVFTNERLRPTAKEGKAGLPLSEVFRTFPMALLEQA